MFFFVIGAMFGVIGWCSILPVKGVLNFVIQYKAVKSSLLRFKKIDYNIYDR